MKLTIGTKLGASFGVVLIILMVFGVFAISQIGAIHDSLSEIIQVKEPKNVAAFEMEINLIGTGSGVLGYLHDRDPEHLERVDGDVEDFQEFLEKYKELVGAGKGKDLGVKIEKKFKKFKEIGARLLKIEDEQHQRMGALLSGYEKIDSLLDDEMQISVKRDDPQAYDKITQLMEFEININGIAKALGNYLRTHDKQYIERVKKDEDDIKRFMRIYKKLNLSTEEKQLAKEFNSLFVEDEKLSDLIIKGHIEKIRNVKKLIEIRRQMDNVLDDEIQVQTNKELHESEIQVNEVVIRAKAVIIVILVLGLIIGSAAAFTITRGITKPLALVSLRAKELGDLNPDLSKMVTVTGNDEISDLTLAFNDMMKKLGESREQLVSADALKKSADELKRNAEKLGQNNLKLKENEDNLRRSAEEQKAQLWMINAKSTLNNKMRGAEEISELCGNLADALVDVIKADIGAVYVAQEDKSLKLLGSYAYKDRQNNFNEFQVGEGLVGISAKLFLYVLSIKSI